ECRQLLANDVIASARNDYAHDKRGQPHGEILPEQHDESCNNCQHPCIRNTAANSHEAKLLSGLGSLLPEFNFGQSYLLTDQRGAIASELGEEFAYRPLFVMARHYSPPTPFRVGEPAEGIDWLELLRNL